MKTFSSAAHTACLDPMTGVGLLVCPLPENDVMLTGETSLSLNAADWDAMITLLAGAGWEPLADDDGLPMGEGLTRDGRTVIALFGLDPITSQPTMAELSEAHSEVASRVGTEIDQE